MFRYAKGCFKSNRRMFRYSVTQRFRFDGMLPYYRTQGSGLDRGSFKNRNKFEENRKKDDGSIPTQECDVSMFKEVLGVQVGEVGIV